MQIILTDCGKRFRFDWVFRGLTHTFCTGERTAVLGPNGSGKSTLMKILSGHVTPSKGSAVFSINGKTVYPENIFRKMAFAAPYIELIEELTLDEAIRFHAQLKPLIHGLNIADIHDLLALPGSQNKEIRFFSSGMKQRVKLALAVCSDTPLLLLDEPTTNLDAAGAEWYQHLVQQFGGEERTIIVASNDPKDVTFCTKHISILDYKIARK